MSFSRANDNRALARRVSSQRVDVNPKLDGCCQGFMDDVDKMLSELRRSGTPFAPFRQSVQRF
jgi:hypothetical protein